MTGCYTCELTARRDAGTAPLWDCIQRTPYWDIVHSYNTSLPGWLVVIARRHLASIDEMSEAESAALGPLLRQVSIALKAVTGCRKTYVVQFAEAPGHPHVHFHVIPRMADLPEERRSTNIFRYLGVPEEERLSEIQMNEIARKVQPFLILSEKPPAI